MLFDSQVSVAGGPNDAGGEPDLYRRDEVLRLVNMRPSKSGAAWRRGGTRKLQAAVLASGAGQHHFGLIDFVMTDGTRKVALFADDTLYLSSNSTNTAYSSVGTPALGAALQPVTFAAMTISGVNYLLAATGGTTVGKLNGTTSALGTLANAPSGTKYIAQHGSRIWAAGAVANKVSASAINDFENWTPSDALDLPMNTADGDGMINGLFSHRVGLLVFKQQSIEVITGYGNSDIIITSGSRGLVRDVGLLVPGSLCSAGGDRVMWLSSRGIELFDGVHAPTRVATNLDQLMRDHVLYWAIQSGYGFSSTYYEAWDEYWLLMNHPTGQHASLILVVNPTSGRAYYFWHASPLQGISAVTVSIFGDVARRTPVSIVADGASFYPIAHEIGTSDLIANTSSATADSGVAYGYKMRTRPTNLVAPGVAKFAKSLILNGKAQGVSLSMFADDNTAPGVRASTINIGDTHTGGATEFSTKGLARGERLSAELSCIGTTNARIDAVKFMADPIVGRMTFSRKDTTRDTFTRADSALTMGSPEKGNVWVPKAGVWGITNNLAYCATQAGGGTTNIVTTETGRNDAIVELDISTGNGLGILRYIDALNYLYAKYSSSVLTINKVVAGVTTQLGGTFSGRINLKIELSDVLIDLYFNSIRTARVICADNIAGTQFGLGVLDGETNVTFDNFLIR